MDISLYIQTLKSHPLFPQDYRHHVDHYIDNNYLIIDDMLYRQGVDSILRQCLTHEEVEKLLNDCHNGACSGHVTYDL